MVVGRGDAKGEFMAASEISLRSSSLNAPSFTLCSFSSCPSKVENVWTSDKGRGVVAGVIGVLISWFCSRVCELDGISTAGRAMAVVVVMISVKTGGGTSVSLDKVDAWSALSALLSLMSSEVSGLLSGPSVGLNMGECGMELGTGVETGDRRSDESEETGEGAELSLPSVGEISEGLIGSGGTLTWARKDSVGMGHRPRELERGGNEVGAAPAGMSTSLRGARPRPLEGLFSDICEALGAVEVL